MIITKEITCPEFKSFLTKLKKKVGFEPNLTNGPWIAGGTARRLWFNEPWKDHDIDIFSSNVKQCTTVRSQFLSLPSIDSDIRFNPGKVSKTSIFSRIPRFFRPITRTAKFSSKNAVTIGLTIGIKEITTYAVQFIQLRHANTIEELFDTFDLTACQFATDGEKLIATENALKDCDTKQLQFNSTYTDDLSFKRIIKYSLYGFEPMDETVDAIINGYINGKLKNADDYY